MVTPTSIAAPAAPARPQRAEITPGAPNIDRAGCTATRHGTPGAKRNLGCTCPDAAEALRIYKKRQRHGLLTPKFVDGIGTQRRIRALQAIGHTTTELAAHLGCTSQHLTWLAKAHDRGDHVHRDSADRITALYQQLHDVPGTSARAARLAAAKGWARPEHWADVDIDDPAAVSDLAYQRTTDRPAGVDAAWLASPAGGSLDHDQIATRLGVTAHDVERMLLGTAMAGTRAHLSEDQVYEIRDRWVAEHAAGNLDRARLAGDYKIGQPALLAVITGRSPKHLGLTDLLGDSVYRRNAGRKPGSPTRDRHGLTAVTARSRPGHDQVDTTPHRADRRGDRPTLTSSGRESA